MLHGVAWKGHTEMCLLRKDPKEVKELIPGVGHCLASIREQRMQMPTCSGGVHGFSSLNNKEDSVAGLE